ncbi:MAG TPA: hypothetical protein VF377_13985 [Acidimicrobiia bacterium]|jgi:hypothetical protein
MTDAETVEALKRAAQRAMIHLLKAGIESVRALEAVIEELSHLRHDSDEPADDGAPRRERIEIE